MLPVNEYAVNHEARSNDCHNSAIKKTNLKNSKGTLNRSSRSALWIKSDDYKARAEGRSSAYDAKECNAVAPKASPEGPGERGSGSVGCRDRVCGRLHPAAGSHLPLEGTAPPCAVAPKAPPEGPGKRGSGSAGAGTAFDWGLLNKGASYQEKSEAISPTVFGFGG
ncbi:hypothetical protein SAMN05216387_1125 [Nitrosovibrio tenuis]|uniref:Uncharacterized protein n=1 Tax=Nitrosovibrio tenuis TaxID=1233 RepID=A0A1H7QHH8_9PROT|nr:hypothetical protein SAMN05216387_1125 [Nitrosovibrio tenuis]